MGSLTEEQLVQMVRDFIESESTSAILVTSPKALSQTHQPTTLTLQEILWEATDYEVKVLEKILMYVSASLDFSEEPTNLKNRVVMKLKMDGFEASLCKTSWASTFDCPKDSHFTGDYEYIDVMMRDKNGGNPTRLIVDMDFRSQFELAKPTPAYKELTDTLPSIFVATEEKLTKVISLLCSAAKQSLKAKGLHIPPWRRVSYMQSKWLSRDCKKLSVTPPKIELARHG
ncbi:Protein of unknown function (DUF506) [Quillaja saponaria]|uniref:Uncharacterized protein n=1 Tax=Quillaja saponaria TaxID=32244 RepID=A0AAD7PS29_QUISA|nr:Protein of unknown function (DUF506) [Quillaja saponaria]